MSPIESVDTYADILGEIEDQDLKPLVQDLSKLYATGTAPVSLRAFHLATYAAAIPIRDRSGRRWPIIPQRRSLAGGMMAATALLVVGVAAYAVAPLISSLLTTERGVATLPMATIGQTQTANGVTVTVDRAYADVNQIVVAYTIQTPSQYAPSTSGIDGKVSLADSQGLTFPLINAQGYAPSNNVSPGLLNFDAEGLAPGTKAVDLRLTFPDVRAQSGSRSGSALDAGAFVFNFGLRVEPGRVVLVGKTVVASGTPMTLERIVISPSEARAYLRFPASAGITVSDWYVNAHVYGSGWDSRQMPANLKGEMTLGEEFLNSSGEHVNGFYGDLSAKHGEWTLTVDAIGGVDSTAPATANQLPKQTRIAGPWTFRFSVS